MTRQILADEPRLQAFIQNRLLWSIRDRVQNQFINGNGQGQNLTRPRELAERPQPLKSPSLACSRSSTRS